MLTTVLYIVDIFWKYTIQIVSVHINVHVSTIDYFNC